MYRGLLYRTNSCAFDKCCSHVKEVSEKLLCAIRKICCVHCWFRKDSFTISHEAFLALLFMTSLVCVSEEGSCCVP